MERMNDRGQAILLDALIFVMVICIVSFALLNSVGRNEKNGDAQQFVERAHRVLLHTAIHWNASEQDQSVSEFLLLYAKHLDAESWQKEEEAIKEVLDFIFLPRFDYAWTVECGKQLFRVGSVGEQAYQEVFASRFVIDQASGTVVTLQAWMNAD